MKFLVNANNKPLHRSITMVLFAALLNLSASVFHFQDEVYKCAGHGTSFYESESPAAGIPASSRMEKRIGSTAAVQAVTLIPEKSSSLNKIKLLHRSFQPRDFHPLRERCFLTSKYSTDT